MLKYLYLTLSISILMESALGACPRIFTRAEWGARPPVGSTTMNTPVAYTVIHHGATAGCSNQAECIAKIKAYQNYHIDTNGWDDIGYNFLVGEDGNIYEGRGWTKVGAHAPNYNTISIGICVIGDFSTTAPNSAAQNALKSLIACGIELGYIKADYTLKGHRQVSSTVCPGDGLYNIIKTWPNFVP